MILKRDGRCKTPYKARTKVKDLMNGKEKQPPLLSPCRFPAIDNTEFLKENLLPSLKILDRGRQRLPFSFHGKVFSRNLFELISVELAHECRREQSKRSLGARNEMVMSRLHAYVIHKAFACNLVVGLQDI